jgi:Na+/serine symporter
MKIRNLKTKVIGLPLFLIPMACMHFGVTRDTAVSCKKWRIHLIDFSTQVQYLKK